jgi:hypothetical protein
MRWLGDDDFVNFKISRSSLSEVLIGVSADVHMIIRVCIVFFKKKILYLVPFGDKDENTFYEEYVATISHQQPL